jgi:hypothetical protein
MISGWVSGEGAEDSAHVCDEGGEHRYDGAKPGQWLDPAAMAAEFHVRARPEDAADAAYLLER